MTAAWQVEGLVKRFGGGLLRGGRGHVAVDGVSLAVAPGERVALIGESGSGKTTVARAGLGVIPKDAGRIRLLGDDVDGWSNARWRQARRHVQLLFQEPRSMLNPAMSLGWLLAESARLHRPEASAKREVARVLDEVGLNGRHRAFPHELSGGEQRRAGIARLLLARPRLVADEPTAGLDAASKASLLELLLDRLGPDCAIVLISHDLPVVAWACERAIVLQHGRIVDEFPTGVIHAGGDALSARHPHTVALLAAAGLAAPASAAVEA